MKAESQTETMIRLSLSEREARWLRAYCQNYFGQGDESAEDYEMRKSFFDTLTSKLPADSGRARLSPSPEADRQDPGPNGMSVAGHLAEAQRLGLIE